jgi:hypothetical protein
MCWNGPKAIPVMLTFNAAAGPAKAPQLKAQVFSSFHGDRVDDVNRGRHRHRRSSGVQGYRHGNHLERYFGNISIALYCQLPKNGIFGNWELGYFAGLIDQRSSCGFLELGDPAWSPV